MDAFKRYELIKDGNNWELYFLDIEFMEWHYIRTYKSTDKISSIYKDIKDTYKDTKKYNIIIKYNF